MVLIVVVSGVDVELLVVVDEGVMLLVVELTCCCEEIVVSGVIVEMKLKVVEITGSELVLLGSGLMVVVITIGTGLTVALLVM